MFKRWLISDFSIHRVSVNKFITLGRYRSLSLCVKDLLWTKIIILCVFDYLPEEIAFFDSIFLAHWENHLKRNIVQNAKTDLLFRFCIIMLNTLFIFNRKIVVCFVLLQYLTLILTLFFLIEALIELIWEICSTGNNYSMYGLGIAQPLRYSDFVDLQRCNWPNF